MNEANEVVLDAIKRLSPEHRQRAESIAVVVEQALASAQNTIAALEKRIAELEAFVKCPIGLDEASDICSAGTCRVCLSKLRQTFDAERQRREDAESIIRLYLTDQRGIPAHLNPGNVYFARYASESEGEPE